MRDMKHLIVFNILSCVSVKHCPTAATDRFLPCTVTTFNWSFYATLMSYDLSRILYGYFKVVQQRRTCAFNTHMVIQSKGCIHYEKLAKKMKSWHPWFGYHVACWYVTYIKWVVSKLIYLFEGTRCQFIISRCQMYVCMYVCNLAPLTVSGMSQNCFYLYFSQLPPTHHPPTH